VNQGEAILMGFACRGNRERTFDWNKAATLIREHRAQEASAGLIEDWDWTGGTILHDGIPVPQEDTYVYLTSTWATPTLVIGDMSIACWCWLDEQPKGADGFYWPESARELLGATA
jgi:hypothetical protein